MCFLKSGIIKIGLFWGVKERPWKMIFRHVKKGIGIGYRVQF